MSHDSHDHADDGQLHVHVMPKRVLFAVWALLVVLTGLTVFSAQYHLGFLDLWVAMGIATIKAVAVLLFFMHLLYDKPFHGFMIAATLVFVFLFFGMSLLDTSAQQGQIENFKILNPKG
ncbi:MAG: cytochrome C oxidase subunit IV family protein [Planctomycetes bacterium]|nr:cytochrome C oxidase subunit IV family protein [Planctomycetota bacterium]